ncbi:phage protein [Streptococcus dysgalactiae subsp. equisimilis]|uniref:YopX family protein n=1 Tax=Streptococcus dysgalactiae TaxID=1334 RepID=UPI0010D03D74|nr:YopX family protein [Streptococcus dysgalactiae]VTT19296.1 phage protein [Streptococcus dysgalactiae subsp. equisimilis]VTT21696.1 phage protein [Streptococcus dysgalactiae subsp. equisimilis]
MIPKFRAWSTFKNEWVKHFYITESGLIYNMEQPHRDLIGAVPVEKSGLILMQSTGLKDKNGVEIFDGDVVDFMVPNQMISGTYQIRQAKSGEWRLDNRVQGRPLYISGSYHCEVVGNVWEDGDLLESVEE